MSHHPHSHLNHHLNHHPDETKETVLHIKGWKGMFGCTKQALALYRILLGILLTCELVMRFRFLHPFYSDQGTLPLRLLLPKVDSVYKIVCVHCHFGSVQAQQIILAIQVVLAVLLTMGYQTRIVSIASWYLYLSLTLRNTWLNFILDRYFHYLLFYSIFLPLDECWSVTSTLSSSTSSKTRKQSTNDSMVVSLATIGLKLQVLWIYLDAGSGKYMDPLGGWTYHAHPLPALDTYARHTVAARYLYALLQPQGLRLMTPTVVYMELLAVPMTLAASYLGWTTTIIGTVGMICSLHLGIALTLNNTILLSLVACAPWAIFLPIITNPRPSFSEQSASPSSSSSSPSSRDNKTEILSTGTTTSTTTATSQPHMIIIMCLCILPMMVGSIWFETLSEPCNQSMKHIWSTLLHNRWNVFVGAEEYVTWEIAPGRLMDGSVVDIWSRTETVNWRMPGAGAPCTSTSRPGRWRSFPYLAELDGDDGEALWSYLCRQWDRENNVTTNTTTNATNAGRKLVRFNFFMLQADVLPNMGFSATRKRLIQSYECMPTATTTATTTTTTSHETSYENKQAQIAKEDSLAAVVLDENIKEKEEKDL